MTKPLLRRNDLLYPELSYEIIGAAFDVYNEIGGGLLEKYYQKALAGYLAKRKVEFYQQVYCPIKYDGNVLGKKFLDFLVEEKIVVEIKKGTKFSKAHIDQVLEYLKTNNMKLALLITFGHEGVMFKRVVNFSLPA